jgi:hypothetical protein
MALKDWRESDPIASILDGIHKFVAWLVPGITGGIVAATLSGFLLIVLLLVFNHAMIDHIVEWLNNTLRP